MILSVILKVMSSASPFLNTTLFRIRPYLELIRFLIFLKVVESTVLVLVMVLSLLFVLIMLLKVVCRCKVDSIEPYYRMAIGNLCIAIQFEQRVSMVSNFANLFELYEIPD